MLKFLFAIICVSAEVAMKVRHNTGNDHVDFDETIKSLLVEDKNCKKNKYVIEHGDKSFEFNKKVDLKKAVDAAKKFFVAKNDMHEFISKIEDIVPDLHEEIKKGDRFFAIYFVDDETDHLPADHNEDGITIFISRDKSLADKINAPFPGIYGFNPVDKFSYKLPLNEETLESFKNLIKTPLLGPISFENYALYNATKLPVVYVFEESGNVQNIRSQFRNILKKYSTQIKFVWVPASQHKGRLHTFGLSEDSLPGIVYFDQRTKYCLRSANPESLEGWAQKLVTNTLEPFYLSQKEPEDNEDRDIKVLTRDNITRYLGDSKKDRLFVFSSPDCAYCVQLKPELEKFAEIVGEHAKDSVFIGECNALENDISEFDVTSYPMVFLIKAGTNERILLDNSSERNVNGLAKFVKEKGTHKIDLTKFAEDVAQRPTEPEPVEIPEKLAEEKTAKESL